tara:strand:+ start:91 stop:297 length:207 start_codon:yes stop_codon:yes gene_type:complete
MCLNLCSAFYGAISGSNPMNTQAQIYEQINAKLERDKEELKQKLERVMFRLAILEAEKNWKGKHNECT